MEDLNAFKMHKVFKEYPLAHNQEFRVNKLMTDAALAALV